MELKEIIGNRIREIRVLNHLSQNDIAKELNVTQASIAQYEIGRSLAPADILLWYANRFDVSLDYIFGRTDAAKRDVESLMLTPGTKENDLLETMIKRIVKESK